MRKILVIEAEGDLRASHLDLLSREGYETIATDNSTIALELIRREYPDLILGGLELSGGDNFELLQYLQHQPDLLSIPIILLTTIRNDLRWRQCVSLGEMIV